MIMWMCSGMEVFVDPGYRTGLGTGFYDRVSELSTLERLVGGYKLVIIYGPRNAGKSELVWYWARRRAGVRLVAFRADRIRSSKTLEGLERLLEAPEERVKDAIISELRRRATEHLNLLSIAYTIYDALLPLGGETVIFIDELHMLPDYAAGARSRRGEVLADLEALAHWLAKNPRGYPRVVLTVSEGFVAGGEVLARLHGYSTKLMLVEGLDPKHYSALYNEYRGARGCSVDYKVVYGVAGGAPGYLPQLCLGENFVVDFIEESKATLEASLEDVRERLLLEGRGYVEDLKLPHLMKLALRLAGGEAVKPLKEPLLYRVGLLLTEHNIVYPSYEGSHIRFKPQLPLYRVLLEVAVERGYESILEVEARDALERLSRAGSSLNSPT